MTTSTVFRRQMGRTVAGSVGALAGLAMFVLAWVEPEMGTMALLLGWAALIPAYVLGMGLGRVVRERDLEFAGLTLPMIAASLLAPLTVHAGVMVAAGEFTPDDFGGWIAMSSALVGYAHLMLGVLSAIFVHVMRTRRDANVRHLGWVALILSGLAACIPGAALYMIPPMITTATGLVFIPWMFYAAYAVMHRERAERLNAAIRHPKIAVESDAVAFHPARGASMRVAWETPFRVVLHRSGVHDDGMCDVHVRLMQERGGFIETVALTLCLPFEDAMGRLDIKDEHLPCITGAPAVSLWKTVRYYAELHGVEMPRGLAASRADVVAEAEAVVSPAYAVSVA